MYPTAHPASPLLQRKRFISRSLLLSILALLATLVALPRLNAQTLLELPASRQNELLGRLTPVEGMIETKGIPVSSGDDGVTLLSERITIVDDLGRRTILRQSAYKSLTDAGAKDNSDETIRFRKKEQKICLLLAETIQPDGLRQMVKPEAILIQTPQRQADYSLYDDQAEMKVIFPNVKPGSVTHLIYVLEDQVAKLPGEFSQSITWAGSWAAGLTRFQVELPNQMASKLKIETVGTGVPAPAISKCSAERTLYTWEFTKRPGNRFEIQSPPSGQIGPAINLTTVQSWNTIAQWYQGLLNDRDTVGPVLAKTVDGWSFGAGQSQDIITAIHRKVASSVRYVGLEFGAADYQPHSCNEVWENQYGDCKDKANLLVALLRYRGISAYITLVNTYSLGLVDRRTPDYRPFNHAIVAIPLAGSGYIFCDPTIEYSSPGMLSPGSSDRDVLIIKDAKAEWAHTPVNSAGTLSYNFDLKLASDGELSGWMKYTADGYYSASERERFVALESEDVRSEMRKMLRGFFAGAEVIDAARDNTPIPAAYTVKAYSILTRKGSASGNKYTLVFPSSSGLFTEVGDHADRKTTFTTYNDAISVTARVALPPGLHASKIPEPFQVETSACICHASWAFDGDVCRAELKIETKRAALTPQEFRLYYQTLHSLQSWLAEPILLTKAANIPVPETAKAEIDLPLMPTGDGQIDLVDRRYPSDGDRSLRREALERTIKSFAEDKETLFRARGRLALIDWDDGQLSKAHIQLASLLTSDGSEIKKEIYNWAELNDGLILRDLKKQPECIAVFWRLVRQPDIRSDYRVTASVNLADLLLPNSPLDTLSMLREVVAAPNCATPAVMSRLIHALLIANQNDEVLRYMSGILGSYPDSYNEVFAAILGDAEAWNIDGDDNRRGVLADRVEELSASPSDAVRSAIAFCRNEVGWAASHKRLLAILNTKPSVNWSLVGVEAERQNLTGVDGLGGVAGHLSNFERNNTAIQSLGSNETLSEQGHPRAEMDSTLKMIAAHATLRSSEGSDPSSEVNREILRIMTQKALKPLAPPPAPLPFPLRTDTFVGTLDGHFSVDNRGAANYTLALRIPESRGGLSPDLTIGYYSGSGDGILGHSFSLSTGFYDSIVRGRSILARDGVVRGVEFSRNDRFYLDGKRLVCVGPPESYGKPGSVYRTEVDSFATITAMGVGDSIDTFVLLSKSGRKYIFGRYGESTDGFQTGFDEDRQALANDASTYALKRVEDEWGNFVEFSYTHAGFGEWLLSRIDYTGGPGIPAPFAIHFLYKQKASRSVHYRNSVRMDSSNILEFVKIYYTPKNQLVAQYQPQYEAVTNHGRYRLTSLEASLSADAGQPLQSLNPMRFQWSAPGIPDAAVQPFSLPKSVSVADGCCGVAAADFNGDGRTDYVDMRDGLNVYLSTEVGISKAAIGWLAKNQLVPSKASTGFGDILTGDFDGDGRSDVMVTAADLKPNVAVSTGNAFRLWPTVDLSACLADPAPAGETVFHHRLATQGGAALRSRLVIGDFNGDGKDDLLVHGYNGRLYLYLSTGLSFSPPIISEKVSTPAPTEGTAASNPLDTVTIEPFSCDMNGDGNTDYVWGESERSVVQRLVEGKMETCYSVTHRLKFVLALPGGSFSAPTTVFERTEGPWPISKGIPYLADTWTVVAGDFNGDDLPDFLVSDFSEKEGVASTWTMILSRGPTTRLSIAKTGTVTTIKRALPGSFTTLDRFDLPMVTAPFESGAWEQVIGSISSGFLNADSSREQLHQLEMSRPKNIFAIDINRDDRDDLVWYVAANSIDLRGHAVNPSAQGWWVCYSKGDGSFESPQKLTGEPWNGLSQIIDNDRRKKGGVGVSAGFDPFYKFTREADYNGDGLLDWTLERSDDGIHYNPIATANSTKPSPPTCGLPDLVTSIKDGLGSYTLISYKAAKDESIYTPGAAVEYPIRDLRAARPVVSAVWHDTGGATPSGFSYQYAGNHLDFSGRGGMGFIAFTTLDLQTKFYKYQFLAHSFPMTGISMREQTYRFWEDGKRSYAKLISSTENQVVFDAVRDPYSKDLFGTVYPFTSKSTEARTLSNEIPDYSCMKEIFLARNSLDKIFPPRLPPSVSAKAISENWYDEQSLTEASVSLPDSNTLRGAITYGNLTRTNLDRGFGQFKRTASIYRSPAGPNDPHTGLVEATMSVEKADNKGPVITPVSIYSYFGNTSTMLTEISDGRGGTDNEASHLIETTYGRDQHGRLTDKKIHSINFADTNVSASLRVPLRRCSYDDRIDLAQTELDADDEKTDIEYNILWREPSRLTFPNKQIETRIFDPLGRQTSVVTDAIGFKRLTDYVWTPTNGTGWQKQQVVAPPPCVTGLTLSSAYAVRASENSQPIKTTYYDRMARVIRTLVEDAKGKETYVDTVYNELGQTVAVSESYRERDRARWTITTYDAYGIVVAESKWDSAAAH